MIAWAATNRTGREQYKVLGKVYLLQYALKWISPPPQLHCPDILLLTTFNLQNGSRCHCWTVLTPLTYPLSLFSWGDEETIRAKATPHWTCLRFSAQTFSPPDSNIVSCLDAKKCKGVPRMFCLWSAQHSLPSNLHWCCWVIYEIFAHDAFGGKS